MLFIITGYVFKFVIAAVDTLPFYMGVKWLSEYLEIDPTEEHGETSQHSTVKG